MAFRERRQISPFVIPLAVSFAVCALAYGEPRYHTPSDLGVIVLAAAMIDRMWSRRSRASTRK
jgi:hypothetical protein